MLPLVQLDEGIVTTSELKQMRASDSVLAQVKSYALNGLPTSEKDLDLSLKRF